MTRPVLELPPQAEPATFGGTPAAPASDVASEVRRRLGDSSYCFLRAVRCEFADGTLTLSGRVPSFYLKQIAQTLGHKVDGVERIVNLIDVAQFR